MLNRTGRLAAAIVIMAGLLFLAIPQSAVAISAFDCGDERPTDCCVPTKYCDSGSFCCFFDGSGGPKFCGCEDE